MTWQDSFVPDNASSVPQAVQGQGWQSSFVPENQPQTKDNSLPGEEIFRQLGLAGRDLAGAVPTALVGVGDIANMGINGATSGINALTGANIPQLGMPTDYVQKGLSATGAFPEYNNGIEKGVGTVAAVLLGGGEGTYNLAKQGYNNLADMLSTQGSPEGSTNLVIPKSSDIKLIKEKLDLAGITPEQYADALTKSTPDDFAGELGGDPLRMQTQAQAKVTGPAMQEARDAMRERLSAAPQRTADIIGNSIKPAPNVEGMLQNIHDMNTQLPDLYKTAYQGTAPSEIVSDIITRPAGQQAIAATAEKLANQGLNPLESGLIKGSDGTWRFTPDVPIQTLDEFQRSLGDLVQRNPITGAVEGSDSATIENMRKNVTSSLGKASPEYQKALNVAAAKQQAESAFDMGRKLAKSSAGETADSIMERASDVMSPNELSYQRAGYARGLTDATQGAKLGGSPVSKIDSGKVQNTVSSILQSPTEAQKFADALMQEKNRIELAQRGLGGSNTAETLTAGIPSVPTSLHGVAASAVNKVTDWATAGKNARIAQLLYATDPEQKAILAKKVLGK